MPRGARLTALIPTLSGYALALLVGALAYWASIPLAWVLGPLVASAALSLAGFDLKTSLPLHRLGQLTIGATVGLNMTAAVLAGLVGWLPLMIGSALVSIVLSAILSVFFARFARLDTKTAFFASLPGGLVEMGAIGTRVGARPEPIAIVQALRVALVVLILPPALVGFGLATGTPSVAVPNIPLALIPVLLAAGCVGAVVLRAVRLNNPWTLGALLSAAALTAAGLVAGRMPLPAFFAAQFVIGFSLGSRFRGEIVRRLPVVTIVGTFTVLALTGLMAGYAVLLSSGSDLDFATATLATSPGGMSEMVATAQTLQLSVPLVVAFHVVRALLVNGFATHHWALLSRLGLFSRLERLLNGSKPSE